MTLTRLTLEDYTTTRWSGGATTELLIRPRGAVYAQRAFLCRVSSATVELLESTFTALPDYDRLIATLDGEIDLVHDGGSPIHLRPYEVHAFDGGSETVSFGRCRDFNLMLRKGQATGSLRALTCDGPCPLSPGTRIALLRFGITQWWIHVVLGTAAGLGCSTLCAIIAKRIPALNFFFFPTKYLKSR